MGKNTWYTEKLHNHLKERRRTQGFRSQASPLSLTCGHIDGLYVVFEGLDDVRDVFNANLCKQHSSKFTTGKEKTDRQTVAGRGTATSLEQSAEISSVS